VTPSSEAPRHGPWGVLLALLAVITMVQWVLWPAWYQPDRWLVGNWAHPDCLSNHWLLAWVAEQVASGGSLAHNTRYYWPVGDHPLLAGNGSEGFLYLPFHALLGWPRAVPPYLFLVLSLNGMAGWALARAIGAGPVAALLAAACTTIWPYTLQELSSGRFSQVDASWLVFFLAAWIRLLDRPSRGLALLSAALLAAASLFYWYYGWFGVVAGAVLAAGWSLAHRRLPPWRPFLLFALTFLLLIAPWAAFFARHWALIPGTGEVVLFPHPQAVEDSMVPAWPFWVKEGRDIGKAMALPAFLVAVGGIGLALAPRAPWRVRALLLVGLLFWALALGPTFPGAPFTALYGLAAPLRRFWWPVRHLVVVMPVMGALGAWFLSRAGSAAAQRLSLGRGAQAVLGLALVAALVAAIPLWYGQVGTTNRPVILRMNERPPVYAALADRDPGVLVQPPLAPETSGAQDILLFQRFHGKTLLTGHAMWVDRVRPDAWDDFVAGNSFLTVLQRLERGGLPPAADGKAFVSFAPQDLQALLDQGVRWFVVDRTSFTFPLQPVVLAYRSLFDTLFGEPVLRDQGVWAWDARNWTGAHEARVPEFFWPADISPAGPEMPMSGRRPKSNILAPP
jgi:hypothetical protein